MKVALRHKLVHKVSNYSVHEAKFQLQCSCQRPSAWIREAPRSGRMPVRCTEHNFWCYSGVSKEMRGRALPLQTCTGETAMQCPSTFWTNILRPAVNGGPTIILYYIPQNELPPGVSHVDPLGAWIRLIVADPVVSSYFARWAWSSLSTLWTMDTPWVLLFQACNGSSSQNEPDDMASISHGRLASAS